LAAVNAAGTSAYAQTDATTNIVTVCFKLRPAAPVLSGATALSSNQIQLSWQDNSNNESSFIIERSADGTTFQPIVTSGTGTTSYIDPNLSSSTQYWYRIKAHNCKGDSDASNVMNATTQAGGGGDTGTGGTGTGGTGTGGNGTGAGGTGSGGGAGTGAGTGTGTGGTGGGNNNIGEQCSLHSECKSGLCFNGKCDEDKDNDGLPRSVDPNDANADVDCDGLKDGQEDKNKNGKVDSDETNPVKSDTDEDGLLDSCDPFPLDKNRPAKSEHKKYLDQCPYAKKTTAWATQPLILALEALSHFVASLFSTTPAFAEEQETSKEFGAFSDPKSIELEGALSAFELFGWPDTKTPTINLWWTDDKNQNVEQYYIWRKTAGASGDPALVGSVSGTAEKKYSDQTGLAWGTEYVYVVKAKRGSAEGESNPKNITTASKLPDPSLPLGSVRIMRAGTEKSSDIFSNFGDAYKHTYEAQAIDTGGNVIQSGIVYTWNLTTQNSEEGSKQAKRAGVEGNLAKQDVTPLKNGSATLSVTASQSQFNVSKNATVSLMIDACNFSWESDASSAALVALDIKLSYCRGKGVAGDALPQLVARPVKIAPRKENYQFQEEYLFPLDGANLGKESNNARIKSDVIIMRVVKAKTYSAATWYADTYKRQPSQRALVNGYSAVQDATTGTYVNAYDTEGDSNTTGPTIYYFTTNTGAQGSTREILNKILERSIFSNGFGYDPSSIDSQGMKLRRDALRMIDAEAYRSAISRASRIPTLESGSFIKHQTISAWPSWQNELGRQLGISAPSDPYPNKDGALCQSGEEGNACKNTCTAQGYDKSTCWKADPNPANRAFGYSAVGERSAVETAIFSHGVRSYSYTYNQNDINKPMKSNFCMLLERLFTSGSHEYCISYQRSAQNMALLGTGAVCSDGAQCASDRCYTGKCADPLAYSTINNPPKIKSVTHDGNNLDGKTFKKTWDSEQKVEFIVTAEDTDGSIVQASATMTTTGVDNNPKTISLDDIEQIIYTQDNTQEPINEGKGKRAKYKMTVDINPANNVVPSGEYTMTIKVMDDFGSEVQRNINFRIDDRTANNPPTLSAPTISISSNSQSNATLMDKKIIVRNARDVSINIAVQASDPDTAQGDAINEVWYEFGNLNEKLNQGEGANYQKNDISLKDVDDGTHHTLLVRATDTRHGLFGTTNGITEMKLEEVVISTNTPPTFKRMQPVDGSKINKGAVLAITGTALDSDGIVEVRLYRKKGDDGAFESVNDPLVGTSTSLLFINFQEQTSDFDLANYTYKLVARDQYGMEGEYTFSVTTVVNGGWSEWGGCSKTCMTTSSDPGNQSRACNNPLPSTNGGAECARSADAIALANQPTTPGNRTETRPCSPPPPFCPIQGGWSKKWASISPDSQFDDNTGGTCSAACGGGWQKKTCDYPPPQHGGSECRREQNTMKEAYGQDASNTNTQPNQRDQYRKCNTGACPAWSYGVCSPTDSTAPSCGPGVQTATCTNATAQGTIDSAQSRCSSPDGAMGGQRTGLSCSLPACPDTDYDGVPDYKEPSTCVGLKGPENNDGCPLPKVTDMQKDRNLYWKGSTPAKVKIAWTSEHADSFDLYYSATPNGTRSQVYANLPANLTYDESSVYISIPEGDNSPRIWFYAKSSGSGIVFIGHHDINVTKPSIEIFPSIGKNEYLTCKKSNSSMTIDRSNTAISLSVRPLLGNYVDSLSVSNMNFNYKAGDGWWHFSTPNTDSQWFIVDATLNMLNGQVNHKQLAQFVSMPAGYSATCTQGGIAQSDLRDDCDGEWASIGIGRDEGEKWYNCSGNEEKLCRDLIRAGNCAGIGGSWCDATWRAVSCHKSTLPKPAGF
ncbi:hypothetical protein HY623_04255, partial [Candidatus Uhrbacteria bacterium]|nr:hypothetical protein [Candidatus Uhrbacteria bacterium]